MSAPSPTPAAPSPPWWAHLVIGAIAIGAGFGMMAFGWYSGQAAIELGGSTLIGSGVTFLGVGAGAALSS